MSDIINARIPLRIGQKLAEYCAKSGTTRTQAVTRALVLDEGAKPKWIRFKPLK